MTFSIEYYLEKAQPAACDYLEFLLCCNEAVASRYLYHNNK